MTTFKFGDRARFIGEGRGTVVTFNGKLVGLRMDDGTPFIRWAYPDGLVPCMSHQALMLWHAMRAGAKRTNGRVMVLGKRKREYTLLAEGSGFEMILAIYGDVPERPEL